MQTSEVLDFVEATISPESERRESLNDMADRIVSIIRAQFPIQGKLVSIQGQDGTINLGTYHGVRPGMRLQIRKPVEIADNIVKPADTIIASAIIADVNSFHAVVKIGDATRDISKGMLVME